MLYINVARKTDMETHSFAAASKPVMTDAGRDLLSSNLSESIFNNSSWELVIFTSKFASYTEKENEDESIKQPSYKPIASKPQDPHFERGTLERVDMNLQDFGH